MRLALSAPRGWGVGVGYAKGGGEVEKEAEKASVGAQPATKPITINRSATAHSAKSARGSRLHPNRVCIGYARISSGGRAPP